MTEALAALATVGLLGVLMALAILMDIERRRRREFAALMEYLAPLAAQFEQTMLSLSASASAATSEMAAFSDDLSKIRERIENCTEQNFGPSPNSVRVVTFRGDS